MDANPFMDLTVNNFDFVVDGYCCASIFKLSNSARDQIWSSYQTWRLGNTHFAWYCGYNITDSMEFCLKLTFQVQVK